MASSAAKAERELTGSADPSAQRVDGAAPPILAIHGFGGTPLEVELVVQLAKQLGRAAYAPLLPGHGTRAEELARSRWADWALAAEAALLEASPNGEPVVVVGLSLGSLLATHLTLTFPERVARLALLANAFWLNPVSALALGAVDRLRLADFMLPKVAADIADPAARRSHVTYRVQPVHAAVDVLRAGQRMRLRLPELRCPLFIAHGRRDRVCPAANAERVARRAGSTDKRLLILPRSRHIITRDLERAELARELARFL